MFKRLITGANLGRDSHAAKGKVVSRWMISEGSIGHPVEGKEMSRVSAFQGLLPSSAER